MAQALAGHADIATTREYYLSVQNGDFAVARKHQEDVLGGEGGISGVEGTDPKLTPKAQKREFAGRKVFAKRLETTDLRGNGNCIQHGSNVQPSVP